MRALIAFLLFAAATLAAAQAYKWVDKDGKVRYGDVPPPGVKATPMRRPSGPAAPAPEASVDPAKKDGAAKKDDKPLSPEAAFRKRQQEREDAEKKAQKD